MHPFAVWGRPSNGPGVWLKIGFWWFLMVFGFFHILPFFFFFDGQPATSVFAGLQGDRPHRGTLPPPPHGTLGCVAYWRAGHLFLQMVEQFFLIPRVWLHWFWGLRFEPDKHGNLDVDIWFWRQHENQSKSPSIFQERCRIWSIQDRKGFWMFSDLADWQIKHW